MRLDTIIHRLNRWAPQEYAAHWDNVGLQLGSREKEIQKIVITLTINATVIDQAVDWGADLIIAHHPLIFKPITSLASGTPLNQWIARLMVADIAVFVMHSNLDIATDGVNDALAEHIGLEQLKVLSPTQTESLYKLVIYTPTEYQDKVMKAVFEAGAGHVGRYSHCGFSLSGQGTFTPELGAKPFVGTQGQQESVNEVRFETLVKASDLDRVIAGMLKAHPYEEVAYDIIPLQQKGARLGLGRYGKLVEPQRVSLLGERLQATIRGLKQDHVVETIALCGGSGADLISKVAKLGISTYVTGDISYHDEESARALGLTLLDMGHYRSECLVLPKIERYLKKIYDNKINFQIVASE